jgi:hypothetical protein
MSRLKISLAFALSAMALGIPTVIAWLAHDRDELIVGVPMVSDFEGAMVHHARADGGAQIGVGLWFEPRVPVTVTHLGRWILPESARTSVLRLYRAEGGHEMGTATVTVGESEEGWRYAAMECPVDLLPGEIYYLAMHPHAPDVWWHEYTRCTTTAAIDLKGALWFDPRVEKWVRQYDADAAFGPLSMVFAADKRHESLVMREDRYQMEYEVPEFLPRDDFGRPCEPTGKIIHGNGCNIWPESGSYNLAMGDTPPYESAHYAGVYVFARHARYMRDPEFAHALFVEGGAKQLIASETATVWKRIRPDYSLIKWDGRPVVMMVWMPERGHAVDAHAQHNILLNVARHAADLAAGESMLAIFRGDWGQGTAEGYRDLWRRATTCMRDVAGEGVALVWNPQYIPPLQEGFATDESGTHIKTVWYPRERAASYLKTASILRGGDLSEYFPGHEWIDYIGNAFPFTIRANEEEFLQWEASRRAQMLHLSLIVSSSNLAKIAAGENDDGLRLLAAELRGAKLPVMLRFGYEFNGLWKGYDPVEFVAAWRRLADLLRENGAMEHVALVWCAAQDGDMDNVMDWYPGDEYVDWWGLDLFSRQHFMDPRADAFVQEARSRGYPVAIAETASRYINPHHGELAWPLFFQPLFSFMARHPNIKQFSYISKDWSQEYEPIHSNWGNSRIQDGEYVYRRYREILSRDVFLHGSGNGSE